MTPSAWHTSCPLSSPSRDRAQRVIAFRTHGIARQGNARRTEMNLIINRLRSLVRDDSGQDLLEYALLVALIALVAVAAVTAAGQSVNTIFSNIAAALGKAA